ETAQAASMVRRIAGSVDHRTARTAAGAWLAAAARYSSVDVSSQSTTTSATQRTSETTTVAGSPSRSQEAGGRTGTARSERGPTASKAARVADSSTTVPATRAVRAKAFIRKERYARFVGFVNGIQRPRWSVPARAAGVMLRPVQRGERGTSWRSPT